MLTAEDNELLCRVGPGTPMGELLREYWIPCLPSSEFPVADSPAKRMMLLGESFVVFRDTIGDIGAVAEACPHRGASLYFGRVEDCGIRLEADSPAPPKGMRGFWAPDATLPELDVERTDYGAYYTSMRGWRDEQTWHRINQFVFPFHTMVSIGSAVLLRSHVPVDDYHSMLIQQIGSPTGPLSAAMSRMFPDTDAFAEVGGYLPRTNDPRSYFVTAANKTNDYQRDLDVERTLMHCGIPFVLNLQDRAMTELMCDADGNPLYDRTQEHLGSTDAFVIAVRAQLIAASKRRRDTGQPPANVDDVGLNRVRTASVILPLGAKWRDLTVAARSADSGEAPRDDVALIVD